MHRLLAAFALLCTLWSQAQVATLSGAITYEDGSAAALRPSDLRKCRRLLSMILSANKLIDENQALDLC